MKIAASLAAFGLAAVALTACNPSSVSSTPKTSASGTPASTTAKAAAVKKTTAPKPVAHVGSIIAIKGEDSGESADVTLVAVDPAAKSTDGFTTPDAGQKFYAVQWRIKDTGTAAYDDSPSNGTVVTDSQGQQFQSTIASTISSGPMLPAETKIIPGGMALGWVVYQVPVATVITGAQFSLDSGFGNAGQWVVP